MRLVRTLLLNLMASAGLAAVIFCFNGAGRVHSESQEAELLLSTLFEAETQSDNDEHELLFEFAREVPTPNESLDPQLNSPC